MSAIRKSAMLAPLAAMLWALPAMAGQPPADAVTGVWLTDDEDGYIQIFEEDGRFYGKTVGAPPGKESGGKDVNNPDPALRDRDRLGIRVLKDFQYNGEGRWENGSAYDPNNGKTYDAWMELDGRESLRLRGFIGFSMFGRTAVWSRVGADAPGVVRAELEGRTGPGALDQGPGEEKAETAAITVAQADTETSTEASSVETSAERTESRSKPEGGLEKMEMPKMELPEMKAPEMPEADEEEDRDS